MRPKNNSRKPASGSPPVGEPEYLIVGYLRRPHGVHGDMVMEVHTDFPERLKPASRVYIGSDYQPMTIAGTRFHNEGFIIKFEGIDSPEAAGRIRNQLVYVTATDRPPLPEGKYYHHELLGLNVVDEEEKVIGILSQILQTGANDVYVVSKPNGDEVLLPVIPSVVLNINTVRQQIHVRLIPGLLDETKD